MSDLQTKYSSTDLLNAIKMKLDVLKKVRDEIEDHWGIEDGIYRFYHQSVELYMVQEKTKRIAKCLSDILPDQPMNCFFTKIVKDGTEKKFVGAYPKKWNQEARPIAEAYFHAAYFLKMAIKYGETLELENIDLGMPSGWAAVRALYNI